MRRNRVASFRSGFGVLAAGPLDGRVEEQVRHRVGGVRLQRARRRVIWQQQDPVRLARPVERVDDGTDDVVYVPESSTASGEGLALVADLPDGVHEIVARETKSGRVVGKATVKVPTDDIILYNVLPAPGGQ